MTSSLAPSPDARAHGAEPGGPSPRRVALASAIGATVEWYDFFLYGAAASLVFGPLFFSGLEGPAAQLAAFGTFAVGFVARPVGGLIFGHWGDRIGRKAMLVWTLAVMGLGTALIGVLPSYDRIGVWAPVLLVTLRVLQGIGVGGEYGGAVLLCTEHAPPERRGWFGSWAHIGVPGGLLLASLAFSLAGRLPDEEFLSWGWRACFLASLVLLAVGAYVRLQVMETPAFAQVQARKEVSTVPVVDLVREQPRTLLLGMGTRLVEGFTYNLFSVYLLAYVVGDLGLPRSWALTPIVVGAGLGVVLVLLSGRLSDRWGRKPVYRVGAWAALLFAFPAAWLVQTGERWALAVAFIGGLGVLYGVIYGPLAAFWSELFEPRYRFTALNTLYQISGVLASGLTPIIAAWLVSRGDGSLWLVATYAVVAAAISLLCARLLPETAPVRTGEGCTPA